MKTNNVVASPVRHDASLLSADDLYLFNEGRNYRAYNQLGSRLTTVEGESGTSFSVNAPLALPRGTVIHGVPDGSKLALIVITAKRVPERRNAGYSPRPDAEIVSKSEIIRALGIPN